MNKQHRVLLLVVTECQESLRFVFSCTAWTLHQDGPFSFWFSGDDIDNDVRFAMSLEVLSHGKVSYSDKII